MPTAEDILAGLEAVALQGRPVAIVWHALALVALVAIARGWRPHRRLAALLLILPPVSVAVLAWVHGNPFNGATFVALCLALGILGARLPTLPTSRPPAWSLVLGLAMLVFGLVYPHFVRPGSLLAPLYSAPTGVVPCPTLSLVIGATLVADGLGSRAWSLVLAGAGLFYGLFGVLRLGVMLDVGLIVGAAALLVRGLMPWHTSRRR
jgi:hypothetical protein